MKSFKKLFALVLSVALISSAVTAGTIAYLQDADSDVNVMTLGNVKIEQIEQERDVNGELVDFTQAKPLYPYVGDLGWENKDEANGAYRVFTMNNVVDKYVTVKNIGKSDAYVRTIIALEMGSFTEDEFNQIGLSINSENGSEFKFDGAWNWLDGFVADIDGHNYYIMTAVHRNPVKPGETTIPSLLQVYLSKEATNEDVEKLDGNGNGLYDIFVKSQAIQTAGFENVAKGSNDALIAMLALDEGFGTVTKANISTIFKDAKTYNDAISNYEEANEKKGKDGSYILDEDIYAENIIHFGSGSTVSLDLSSKTIYAENKNQYIIGAQQGATLTLTGKGAVTAGKGFMANKGDSKIIIEGGDYSFNNTSTLNNIKHNSVAQNNATIVINGGTFTTDVVDACLFFATSNGRIEVKGGFFENTNDTTPDLFSMGTNKSNTK